MQDDCKLHNEIFTCSCHSLQHIFRLLIIDDDCYLSVLSQTSDKTRLNKLGTSSSIMLGTLSTKEIVLAEIIVNTGDIPRLQEIFKKIRPQKVLHANNKVEIQQGFYKIIVSNEKWDNVPMISLKVGFSDPVMVVDLLSQAYRYISNNPQVFEFEITDHLDELSNFFLSL